MAYDSARDTMQHIQEVRANIRRFINDMKRRAEHHDKSKLKSPEKEAFDIFSPKLAVTEYMSEEYKAQLEGMKPALKHHYEHNDHHPEHFAGGVMEMNLMQITEMLCDWQAATRRVRDGDLRMSIIANAERFGFGIELRTILLNTAYDLGWIGDE